MKFSKTLYPRYSEKLREKIIALDTSPAVIYDKQFITETVKNLQTDLRINEKNQLFFAMKANHNTEILKIFKALGLGIDIASVQEYNLAKKIGFKRISAMNPTFTQSDFSKFDDDTLVDIDSLSQLKRFVSFQKNKTFGLRIKTVGEYCSFGISLSDHLFKYINENRLQRYFKRIHFHNSNRSLVELRKQLEIAINLIDRYPAIDTINLGGDILGFYRSGRHEFLKELFRIKADPVLSKINFIYEPGDALIKYGGMLLTSVIAIKKNADVNYAFLDSSKWISGPWHMGSPIVLNNKTLDDSFQKKYYFFGNTMFSGDTYFDDPITLPELYENDRLLFPEYGAYTLSNYRGFHMLPKPTEYMYIDGTLLKI
ncbi:hypothetical protein HZY91_02485 [Facklamia sp. DSM 111018]|uniref:Orn/DAP/Arg decarboxylase 2 N-terminal domain-containing protein n=1 Tax=Facklamia lactis TaxID=2749967 RepID=A0ABS0LP64_9LACT|nr:hypothetical protein [Facklamia lactis]MBG9985757.1 hypothetical protein [Facklamia lactis]